MTRITIVTITWNAGRTLQRTLDSVARQTHPAIEHLIVDGASTDDTLAVARRYQSAVPYPVVVTSEPDHGLYDAMNKGLQRATGDYLVFLNAGDALHAPDTLATVAACALPATAAETAPSVHGPHPAVIYGDTDIVDAEGHYLRPRHLRPPERLTWRSFRHGMLVCHQAFYVRTDVARTQAYDLQYRHSADVDWCIRVMREADRQGLPLVNTHAVLADFEDGGDTTQHHRASLLERFRVMRRHYGLPVTVAMHAWFLVRAAVGRLRR